MPSDFYTSGRGSQTKRGGWDAKTFRKMYLDQLGGEVPGAQAGEEAATAAATNFNAQDATDRVLGAAQNRLSETMGRELETLAGRSAGMGRLDTGFWDLDQGDVVRSVAQDFTNTANSTALQVAGMQQGQTQFNQRAAADRRDRSYDLMFGGWDQYRADVKRWDKQNASKGWFSKLAGGALGVVTGGLAGKAGEKLAEKLF